LTSAGLIILALLISVFVTAVSQYGLAVILIGVMLLSLRDLTLGSSLLVAAAPLEDVLYLEVSGFKIKLYEFALLGLAAGILLRRPRLRIDAIGVGLIAYAAYGMLTVINSVSLWDTLQLVLFEFIMVLIALTMRSSLRDPASVRNLNLFSVIVVSNSLALYGLGQLVGYYLGFDVRYWAPGVYPIFRPYATFIEPNFYGNYLASILALALVLLVSPTFARWRHLLLLTITLQLPLLVVNLSRGPWVGLAVAVLVYTLVQSHHRRRLARAVILVGIPLLLFGVMMIGLYAGSSTGWSAVTQRLDTTINPLTEGAASERMADIQLSLQLWQKHPLIGSGVGTWGIVAYGLLGRDARTPPRNIFLAWLYEKGLIGTAIAVGVFGLIVLKIWFAYRHTREEFWRAMILGTGLSVLAVFITFQFTRLDISPFYWVQIGLLLASLDLYQQHRHKDDAHRHRHLGYED